MTTRKKPTTLKISTPSTTMTTYTPTTTTATTTTPTTTTATTTTPTTTTATTTTTTATTTTITTTISPTNTIIPTTTTTTTRSPILSMTTTFAAEKIHSTGWEINPHILLNIKLIHPLYPTRFNTNIFNYSQFTINIHSGKVRSRSNERFSVTNSSRFEKKSSRNDIYITKDQGHISNYNIVFN